MSEDQARMDDTISAALAYDALRDAEQITGQSYKSDDATGALGFLLHIGATARKNDLLEAADDTALSTPVSRYLRIARDEGFETIYTLPFKGRYRDEDTLYILWQPQEGILLRFDTFGFDDGAEPNVNGGSYCYNWRPQVDCPWYPSYSGYGRKDAEGPSGYTLVGYNDCREGLRHNLRQMRQYGVFVTPWIEQPWLWMLHYMDTKDEGYDYKAITAHRLSLLPLEVQVAVGHIKKEAA